MTRYLTIYRLLLVLVSGGRCRLPINRCDQYNWKSIALLNQYILSGDAGCQITETEYSI